jgi:3-phosphoshikimate 1-carboxyvinyltransferase
MTATISPSVLGGSVTPPPSKSYAHRALICAALSAGESKIENIALSDDITATTECLKTLGADIKFSGNTATVSGIKKAPETAVLDCKESGSTLRFLIPVCAALGVNATFTGSGKLPYRPIDTYISELSKHGILLQKPDNMNLPLTIRGQLVPGLHQIYGDISSQFITGTLFAFPLAGGYIVIHSPLQSKGYVDMTIDVLKSFGVKVDFDEKNNVLSTKGKYKSTIYTVENDWSQAAFWYAADNINVEHMRPESKQADKQCAVLLTEIKYKKAEVIDVSQIPDLLPILASAAALYGCNVTFTNAERLVIKESNRLKATADMINALGGKASYDDKSLTVTPGGKLVGGMVDGVNDHRIVMSAAIVAAYCKKKVIIKDAQAVKKSYPDFWDVYKNLGGKVTFTED